jgi:hypothetical protein
MIYLKISLFIVGFFFLLMDKKKIENLKKHQFFLINMTKLKNHLSRIGPVKINYINLMALSFQIKV